MKNVKRLLLPLLTLATTFGMASCSSAAAPHVETVCALSLKK